MKIGIVCYPTFGGSGVIATELGKALAEKGHSIHFITYSQPVRLDFFSENISYHEVAVANYPLFEFAPYESALTSKLVDVVKYEKLDILHVHYAIPHASVAWLAKQILATQGIHIPIVTTLHGTDITLVGKDMSFEPVVTFAINHSDGVTTVSESLKQDTYKNFKIEKEIEVIHNFIDLERFSKKAKDHFKKAIAPFGEKLIVHTSNFRKVKRVQDVVHAFDQIIKELPAKLLLIGDGPERPAIEKLCRDLGNCEHVRFLGKQEAIEEILSVCDLFMMPSESESFGLAALEAMACQVPVISSNTGGMPELNIHGVTGYLSDVGNVDEMARYAIDLLKDPEKHNAFKKNALEQAKKFDIHVILPKYEKFYQKVIESMLVK
ncbi:MAG: N-acetyl-alpha-D-glucosaminyl L-malate synthase BshA [Bacteroidetes bacterium]|nr:N-acetyl-alpha-D-glucosaminyl L-malate synthase BshA [Bacteroidota bacterium]MBK7967813.1 N-acetyl-alpha-D-glucosaminyl L-malate synthase BshA [Bacteroidota bacterium]MBK9049264.1 N-acetyl-alpha-D-glucosaminyl L-malate synthase BshA [Bacteroidota bacterium]MBK9423517.1 N-acetyl-alpha-D-glucosaminyl L-malate synthase BshA [Bacteroidota bacterium]